MTGEMGSIRGLGFFELDIHEVQLERACDHMELQ